MKDLALGVLLHEDSIGVNRFVHQNYKGGVGYAFSFHQELFAKAKELFNMNNQLTDLACHFAVEKAIEIHLAQKHPEIEKHLKRTFEEIDIENLNEVLAAFTGVSAKEALAALKFVASYPANPEGLSKLWSYMLKRVQEERLEPKTI